MNRSVYVKGEQAVRQNPKRMHTVILYSMVSRNLERVADLATNIAQDVISLIEGDIVRHRGDRRTLSAVIRIFMRPDHHPWHPHATRPKLK